MDPVAEKVGERRVHGPLALHPPNPVESRRLDLDREVALARPVVSRMAAVAGAVVDHGEPCRLKGGAQPRLDLAGDGAGESLAHRVYIGRLISEGESVASAGSRQTKYHGRAEPRGLCAHPGCDAPAEFRAPAGRGSSFDGPGEWRWLCLDHVREFNAGYNYFEGMSSDEIQAANNPYGGWDRETRAFAHMGADGPPRWADFQDPLDAIGARFRRAAAEGPRLDGRELSEPDRKSLRILGLGTDADRRTLRRRYADLLRRYHPDHNGGDRGHEKALQAVIEAYTHLKSRPAFA